MGINERLLTLDYATATIRANTPDSSVKKPTLPERIRPFSGAAEKIGYWFSKLSFQQVASILAVEF